MWSYLDRLLPVPMSRNRSKQKEYRATSEKESAYRGLAGTLMYLGNAFFLQAAMHTSRMKQKLGDLTLKHFLEGNAAVKEMLNLRPYIRYLSPGNKSFIRNVSLSDVSHGGSDSIYGRTSGLCGLFLGTIGSTDRIYHPVSWTSHKKT